MNETFILYRTQCKSLLKLTDLQLASLIRQIIGYVFNEEEPEAFEDLANEVLFDQIRDQIDRDQEKYRKKCEKNRQIAIDREAAKKQGKTDVDGREQTYTNTLDRTESRTFSDTGDYSEDENDVVPSSSEVRQFILENYPNIADKADRFYSHCQKNGWNTWKLRAKRWSEQERPEGKEEHGKRFNGEESSIRLWQ